MTVISQSPPMGPGSHVEVAEATVVARVRTLACKISYFDSNFTRHR